MKARIVGLTGWGNNKSLYALLCTACLNVLIIGNLFASGLIASITLSEPDGDFFTPGDNILVTLTMIDRDNGSILYADEAAQNGLMTVQLWVAGPRHNYHLVEPYVEHMIVSYANGWEPDCGFDPETGEIEITLPDEIEMSGTYTVQFKCKRAVGDDWFSKYPRADFQLNQIRPTFTQAERYLISCRECHEGRVDHGTYIIGDCFVCHTRDFVMPMNTYFHEQHHVNGYNTCHGCHRAVGGIGNYGRASCFSCHNVPGSHQGYTDNQCANCHQGELSSYNAHNEYTPDSPDAFNLFEPEDEAIISELSIDLSWQASGDDDQNDLLWYMVEVALDDDFENVRIIDAGENTSLTVENLVNDREYRWRVRAADLNTDGTFSTQTRRFSVQAQTVEDKFPNIPEDYSIPEVYPNPFNSTVNISFGLPEPGHVNMQVFNLTGREVGIIADGTYNAGNHTLSFDAEGFAGGIYFIKYDISGKKQGILKVLFVK